MADLYHLNCVSIQSPIGAEACGHCLLIRESNKLILIDTGIGLKDIQNPAERIGKELVSMVGYRFEEKQAAVRQIARLGFDPGMITDCIISHLDNDHIGGLADFPQATVHLGQEEYNNFLSGNPRYLKIPLQHGPLIKTYMPSSEDWFGFEARPVQAETETEIYLIPLFGHTMGHCGIALKHNENWIFYVADAYYLKDEFENANHPVHELAASRADDNLLRIQSLEKIRSLKERYPAIQVYCYHDITEFNGLFQ